MDQAEMGGSMPQRGESSEPRYENPRGRQQRSKEEAPSGRTQPLPRFENREAPQDNLRSRRTARDKDVDGILSELERKVREARKIPFSEQCVLDRYELLVTIDNIRKVLPEDLQKAKWLLSQNHQLIAQSRKEAEKMLREAEQQMAAMIDDHEITQRAREEAQRLLDEAASQSRQIHREALEYAGSMLHEIEEQLTEMLVYIKKNKKDLNV